MQLETHDDLLYPDEALGWHDSSVSQLATASYNTEIKN